MPAMAKKERERIFEYEPIMVLTVSIHVIYLSNEQLITRVGQKRGYHTCASPTNVSTQNPFHFAT
jgi:hypothetical protein